MLADMKKRWIGLCFLAAGVWGGEPIKIVMTPEHWKTTGAVEFVKHNRFDAMEIKPRSNASPADLSFRNGTIEFDVDQPWSMGTGIAFRREKDSFQNFEYFYLRPQANCAQKVDCIQYAPQTHGVLLWDVFPEYQGPAHLEEGQWNHVKLVVSGQRMNIFVNDMKSPALKVGRLEADTQEGEMALAGPGFFANVSVTPDAVEGLSAKPDQDPTAGDGRYVRNWQVSPFSTLAKDAAPAIGDLPATSAAWTTLAAERNGLVNLSRDYGVPLEGKPDRPVAWLKTTITSNGDRTKKVAFGWVREAWVFVNGQLVFADKNLYQPPSARKTPDGRCSIENGSFELPLKAGVNEIDVALACNFYGWGLILRLDDLKGVQLSRK
jgi:hypothetical protein